MESNLERLAILNSRFGLSRHTLICQFDRLHCQRRRGRARSLFRWTAPQQGVPELANADLPTETPRRLTPFAPFYLCLAALRTTKPIVPRRIGTTSVLSEPHSRIRVSR